MVAAGCGRLFGGLGGDQSPPVAIELRGCQVSGSENWAGRTTYTYRIDGFTPMNTYAIWRQCQGEHTYLKGNGILRYAAHICCTFTYIYTKTDYTLPTFMELERDTRLLQGVTYLWRYTYNTNEHIQGLRRGFGAKHTWLSPPIGH
jgi:hypothetical protein